MPTSVVFWQSSLGPFAVQAGTCAHSICTCLAYSALTHAHTACDTLAGTSAVTTSTSGVAEDIATVVCDAAVIASRRLRLVAPQEGALWATRVAIGGDLGLCRNAQLKVRALLCGSWHVAAYESNAIAALA